MEQRLILAVQHGRTDEVRSLLVGIENVDEEFPHRFLAYSEPLPATLLLVATESLASNLDIIKLLIGAGANVNHCHSGYGTALCWACVVGQADRVQVLLEAGATPWPIKQVGRNFLISPQEDEKRRADLSIWQPGEIGTLSAYEIPLFMAAKSGSSTCIQLLLNAGFPADFENSWGGYQTRNAMFYASNQETVEILIQAGLEQLYLDNQDYDPIHEKLENSEIDAARALIDLVPSASRQALLNQKFLLFCGFDYVSLDVLKFLVELGADPAFQDPESLGSPLHWAVWQSSGYGIETNGEYIELLGYLLEHGANVNLAKDNGTTPLHDAVYGDGGDASATKFLIDHGANVNAVDDEGQSPLILACIRGELPCVQLLLNAGADRGIVARDGSTALSNALARVNWKHVQDNPEYFARAWKIVQLLEGN